MTTCTKLYTDIPFAHRQPNHEGHCSLIHGHNWSFEIEFVCKQKDKCGFVIDFGKLQDVKQMLNTFDHALLLNEDDPGLMFLQGMLNRQASDAVHFARIVVVPDCSCEGLAEYVLAKASDLVQHISVGRVKVVRVTCYEDSKNSASAKISIADYVAWKSSTY